MIDVIDPQFGQATQQCRDRDLALYAGQLGAASSPLPIRFTVVS
jgi:hypothetical protein